MNSMPTHANDEARPDVDDVLRGYFKSEMPRPWPMLNLPATTEVRSKENTWLHDSGRWVLAACVALMVAGYLTLAGFFPRSQSSNGVQPELPEIGLKEKRDKAGTPRVQPHQVEEPQALPMPIKLGNTGR